VRSWSACSSRTPTSSSKAVVRFSTDTSSILATGKSGLILDIVIETGNPADAERFVSMIDRHIARTGASPRADRRRWWIRPPRPWIPLGSDRLT
jgi:hypothetical protein